MRNYRNVYGKSLIAILLIVLMWISDSLAGELTLAWDPNPADSNGASLIGYNLYYKADTSVAADPDGADLIYIPLADPDFDPDQPSYRVTGLSDSQQYYFVVTAMYNDEESAMSNEANGFTNSSNGHTSTIDAANGGASAGSSSGGCFIDSLR